MKTISKILITLVIFVFLMGCSKETKEGQNVYTVESFDKVSVNGNAKVLFVEKDASHAENTVHIISGQAKAKEVGVVSTGGVLYISVNDGIQPEDELVIMVVVTQINEIRLEGGHEAEFEGPFDLDELYVVTKGNSRLVLSGLRVARLTCQTDGGSELILNTYTETFSDDQVYDESRVVQLDSQILLVDGLYIVYGDSVKLQNGSWTVMGSEIKYQYRITLCDHRTVGNTIIKAANAPTKDVAINLEGTSRAEVWAFDHISGRGVGTSILYYVNQDGLDITGFITEGDAQILPLP